MTRMTDERTNETIKKIMDEMARVSGVPRSWFDARSAEPVATYGFSCANPETCPKPRCSFATPKILDPQPMSSINEEQSLEKAKQAIRRSFAARRTAWPRCTVDSTVEIEIRYSPLGLSVAATAYCPHCSKEEI